MHSKRCMSASNVIPLSAARSERPLPRKNFREIYDAHLPLVWRTLRRFGVPDAALDDAVQDVFTVVHTKIDGFEGRSSMKTWLFGIARRIARNHRDKGREKLLGAERNFESTLPSHPAEAEKLERVRFLYRLLDQLPTERREIFVLVEIEELTVAEASDVLEENPNTLASRLKRARQDLKDLLARAQAHDEWRSQCASST